MSLPQRLPPPDAWEPPPASRAAAGFWTLRRLLLAAVLLPVGIALVVSWAHQMTPAGIVIHHTGPLTEGDAVTLPELDELHRSRGFGAFYYGHVYHVGYHYVIFPDGRVVPARPEHLRGAHTQHYNNYLGIVLVGDFSSKNNRYGRHGLEAPTEAQLASLVFLCRRLDKKYGIALDHVRPHRDFSQTLCPGDRFPWDEFLSRLEVNYHQPKCPPLK